MVAEDYKFCNNGGVHSPSQEDYTIPPTRMASVVGKGPKPHNEMSKIKTRIPQVRGDIVSQSHTGIPVRSKDSGGSKSSTKYIKQRTTLHIATYNARSISTEERLEELEHELGRIKWDILGISETRRRGEECVTLRSGNVLFCKGKENSSHGGVGIIINKNIAPNIKEFKTISDRIISITIAINRLISLKIIQVYAPTTGHDDEEVEIFYEEIAKSLSDKKNQKVIVMGDFNSKVGKKQDDTEIYVGSHGLGTRNDRGTMLVNFLEQEKLYNAGTFYEKNDNRKWTWISPDGRTKNQIDFILTRQKHMIQNIEVLNAFNTGSDHRLLRARIQINQKLERSRKMNNKKEITIDRDKIRHHNQQYQESIANTLSKTQSQNQDLNTMNGCITSALMDAAKQCAVSRSIKNNRLSEKTKDLLQQRRDLIANGKRHSREYAELNKTVRKMAKEDIQQYKMQIATKLLEENKGMATLRRQTTPKKILSKLKDKEGKSIVNQDQILKLVEHFYENLYETKVPSDIKMSERGRTILNVNSEDIPAISRDEIEYALKLTKNNKAAGEDDILPEMLKEGGSTLIQELEKLFNACLQKGKVPESWANAIVVILHKKGDRENIENYRPISLLSQMYKLFSRIITNRLENKLDFYQPKEQAGFRKNFSTIEHLQTVRTVIEKSTEYNIPLWMAFVDYTKAFDTVEKWAVIQSLKNARIDSRYITLIENIYKNATMQVRIHENTEKIKIERGVRQGDIMSPKLFTLALEDVFKRVNWQSKGITISGERLHHLRFADDVVLFSHTREELVQMIEEINVASNKIGLKINYEKTKFMTNVSENQDEIVIGNNKIQKVQHYTYLGQKITIGKENQELEIKARIRLGWAAYGKLRDVLETKIPLQLKAQLYNQCILPVMTYGAETWVLTKKILNKMRTAQRAMERKLLGITLNDRKTNIWIRQRTGVTDIAHRIATIKWTWAGHVARAQDKWSGKVVRWRPWGQKRPQGRPQMRWVDDLKLTAGLNWYDVAQNRKRWKFMGEAYIQKIERIENGEIRGNKKKIC